MNAKKIIILAIVAILVACFFIFDLGQYFSLEYIKSQQEALNTFYQENQWQTILGFFLVYVAVAGLSLPGATILTLLGGAIFGLVVGTIVVSFASTIGATVACLVSRVILRDWVQDKFGSYLKGINEGIEKEGSFYLFTMRLVPAIPFFVVNLVMGLTPLKLWKFYIVSQLGMLAGTIVYVNAGTQLAKLDSLSGIASPTLIASFVALGVFPIVAKKLIDFIKNKRAVTA